MDEYIKREAAIEAVKHAWAKGLEPSQYIEIISAANVAPVRHGRWIIDSVGGKIACSDCGCIYLGHNGGLPPNYCPNCGADMRGSNDE